MLKKLVANDRNFNEENIIKYFTVYFNAFHNQISNEENNEEFCE